MKKTVLLIMISISCLSMLGQEIPKKMLRGIDVEKDEFSGNTTYMSKNGFLKIIQDKDSIYLNFILENYTLDGAMDLTRIIILTNGKTTTIDRNDDFKSREVPTRRMSRSSTGNFGTSSYRPAEFETRMMYVDTWETSAQPYMEIINSLIQNTGKVKFEGSNGERVLEINANDAKKMKSTLDLYDYLIKN